MQPAPTAKRPLITRRGFLRAAGCAAAIAAGFGGYARFVEPRWIDIVRHKLPIAHLPASLEGAILAQLSDLHVGPQVDSDFLIDALGQLAQLHPDALVITGDLMSCRGTEQIEEVLRVLKRFPIPPLGAYVIPGNHDYGAGWADHEVADRLAARMNELGFTTLRNQKTTIKELTLIGLDDYWGPCFGPQGVLADVRRDEPSLVLCHNPDAADEPVWGDYPGWILAGHTHGGQCKPPFLPPPLLPVKNRRYTSGDFALTGGRSLYINRGLGTLRAVRFNARPEITLHQLTRAT